MAKKYVLRSFKPGEQNHNHVNPLINLSSFGLQSNQSIMKNALLKGAWDNLSLFVIRLS